MTRAPKAMPVELNDKLRHALKSRFRTEAQVCYVLVLTRKLLEQLPRIERKNFLALEFYCDWALHTRLTKYNAGVLLQEFDRQIPEMLARGHQEPDITSFKVMTVVNFIILLVALWMKNDIAQPSNSAWAIEFMRIYLNMICECPVSYSADQIDLKHIDRLMVTRDSENAARFKWQLSLQDTTVHDWNIDMPMGL